MLIFCQIVFKSKQYELVLCGTVLSSLAEHGFNLPVLGSVGHSALFIGTDQAGQLKGGTNMVILT